MGLHGSAMRMLSDITEQHHNGLEIAARHARNQGRISSRMYKKLVNVSVAYNVVRHITRMSCKDLLANIASEAEETAATDKDESQDTAQDSDSVEVVEPSKKKVKVDVQEHKEDVDTGSQKVPEEVYKDVGEHGRLDFLLLKKRVDVLEMSEEQREQPVGDVIKSAPVVWGMVQDTKKAVGDIQKEIVGIHKMELHFSYFCRDIIKQLERICPGSSAQLCPPFPV